MSTDMAGDAPELELRNYLTVLWRQKLLIVAVMALCALAAYQRVAGGEIKYRATTDVLLQQSVSEQVLAPPVQGGETESRARVQNAIEVITARSVENAAEEVLGHEPDVTVLQKGETDVLSISSAQTVPSKAVEEAQSYAEAAVQVSRDRLVNDLLAASEKVQAALDAVRLQIAAVEAPLIELDEAVLDATDTETRTAAAVRADTARAAAAAQLQGLRTQEAAHTTQLNSLQIASQINTTGGLQIISEASTDNVVKVGPKPRRDAVVGALVGLLLGVVLAFVWNHFDDRIRNRRDLQSAAPSRQVLSVVPALRPGPRIRRPAVVSLSAPDSAAAEGYRALRATVQLHLNQAGGKVVMVTSPGGRDARAGGEATANLASALGSVGARVVAVDCDLHRPQLDALFDLRNDRGVTTVLNGTTPMADSLQRHIPGSPTLEVLTTGPSCPNPSDLVAHEGLGRALAELAAEADYLVVHVAPVLSVTDAMVLTSHVDAVVVAAAAKRTTTRRLAQALESLEQIDAPVLGTVLTDAAYRRQGYRASRRLLGRRHLAAEAG